MISLSSRAERQLDDLIAFYEQKGRPEATRNLLTALQRASLSIEQDPASGLPAPRPYPHLAGLGRRWIKEGSYWVCYADGLRPVILGVHHEAANIPDRA